MVSGWRVEARDANLFVTGPVDIFTGLKIVLRHRRAGGWILSLPADHPQASLFTEGSGLIVWAPWSTTTPLLSGPATKLSTTTSSREAGSALTVEGVDDTALLADRLVMPSPADPMDQQGAASHWMGSGLAEKVIRDVVDVNAGDAARAERRLCDADPDNRRANGPLVGTTRTIRARFDNLLALTDEIATTDNLTVRLVQPGSGTQDRHLEVGLATDRSAYVRLSQSAGTLTSATANLGAPGATTVLVAGGGEDVERVLVERSTALGDWSRRIEAFRDSRGTVDTTELQQAGDEVLAGAANTAGLTLEPVDTAAQRFGYDYGLGDTVTVDVAGSSYTDIITAVDITIDANGGAQIRPVVGDPDLADKSPLLYQRVRSILRRLDNLERWQ